MSAQRVLTEAKEKRWEPVQQRKRAPEGRHKVPNRAISESPDILANHLRRHP